MPDESLTSTVRRGMRISAVMFVVVQAISLVQMVVLARLLTPVEIGIFTAGNVLYGFVISVAADGMGAALVQRKDRLADSADTVFWATLASGTLLGFGALAVSPLIGLAFDNPTAGAVAAASAGSLLLHSLTVVPDSLMQRRFDFRRRMIVSPAITVGYCVPAIVAAAAGMGVWSLVLATYTSLLCWLVTTWWLAGWWPGRGHPSLRLWRELARYSTPLVAHGLAWRLRETIETFVVGQRLGEAALGQYRYSRRLAMLPGFAILEICSYVLLPAFSRISDDVERFRSAFRKALGLVWTAAVGVAGVVVVTGEPLVVVLLGEQWRGAGIALVAMAGFGMGEALCGVADEATKASGRSKLLNWTSAVSLVATLGLTLLLVPYGLVGVGIAISTANVAMGLTAVTVAARVTAVRARDLAGALVPPVLAGAVGVAALAPLEHLVVRSAERLWIAGLGLLVLEALAFGVVYLLALRVVAPGIATGLLASLRQLRHARGSR